MEALPSWERHPVKRKTNILVEVRLQKLHRRPRGTQINEQHGRRSANIADFVYNKSATKPFWELLSAVHSV